MPSAEEMLYIFTTPSYLQQSNQEKVFMQHLDLADEWWASIYRVQK
jgi:hypothetical protein